MPFIIQDSPLARRRTPKLHFEWLEEMRRFLQWRSRDAILLGEANVLPKDTLRYFGEDGQGIQMMFNFFVNQHLFHALASEDAEPLAEALRRTAKIPRTAQWAQFLRNHDELDLGRLTEAQRQQVFSRFGPTKDMQLYDRGIRRRLAPMLGDRRNMELAYSMLFALPGTPVIRYGDEIGMGEDLSLEERQAVRNLRIKGEGGDLLTNLLIENESRAQGNGAHRIAVEEFGYRWYRVGGLGYALKRARGRPEAQSPK